MPRYIDIEPFEDPKGPKWLLVRYNYLTGESDHKVELSYLPTIESLGDSTAEWKISNVDTFECSNCGAIVPLLQRTPYCAQCGKKMIYKKISIPLEDVVIKLARETKYPLDIQLKIKEFLFELASDHHE